MGGHTMAEFRRNKPSKWIYNNTGMTHKKKFLCKYCGLTFHYSKKYGGCCDASTAICEEAERLKQGKLKSLHMDEPDFTCWSVSTHRKLWGDS